MGVTSEKMFKDLQFVHFNKEIILIFTKPLEGLIKTVSDV